MADLAAADVTVSISERRIVGKKRRNILTLTFGDGAKTYPTGGIPMPAAGSFGMVRNLDFLNVLDDSAGVFLVKYDKTNNKLRYYWPSGGVNAPAAAAASVDPITMTGAATASAVDATQPTLRAGRAKEFVGTTTTIAAQTLQVEAVGW